MLLERAAGPCGDRKVPAACRIRNIPAQQTGKTNNVVETATQTHVNKCMNRSFNTKIEKTGSCGLPYTQLPCSTTQKARNTETSMQTHVNDYMSLQHQKINVFMKNIGKTGPGHHFFRHVKKDDFQT